MRILFTFLFLLALLSCNKSGINNTNTSNSLINGINGADSFYFKGKIDGKDVSWIVPSHKNDASFSFVADAHHGYSDFSGNCVEGYCYYIIAGSEIRKNVIDATRPGVAVSFNMATSRKGKEEIISWFSVGTKVYGLLRPISDLLNPAYNGVNIYYVDQNGNDWSTLRGLQQGSFFESVLFNDEPRTDIVTQKIWKAKFSCKLYNNFGQFINIENGEIFGPILLP